MILLDIANHRLSLNLALKETYQKRHFERILIQFFNPFWDYLLRQPL